MKTSKKKTKEASTIDPRFVPVVEAFAGSQEIGRGTGKGFGSRGLKANGKIFAMTSSKGQFVVKLPKERVSELVTARRGAYFDPGRGRLMKEWLAVSAGQMNWVDLAKEAYHFVKPGARASEEIPE